MGISSLVRGYHYCEFSTNPELCVEVSCVRINGQHILLFDSIDVKIMLFFSRGEHYQAPAAIAVAETNRTGPEAAVSFACCLPIYH